jgi:hypothetical protein
VCEEVLLQGTHCSQSWTDDEKSLKAAATVSKLPKESSNWHGVYDGGRNSLQRPGILLKVTYYFTKKTAK